MEKSHRTTSPDTSAEAPSSSASPRLLQQDQQGNAALLEQLDPLRRVFDKVAGEGGASFGVGQVEQYLDKDLQFAEGEWFRGKKLSGAAEGLMSQLDADGDGQVSAGEFEAFRTQTLAALAPSTGEQDDEDAVRQAAGRQHSALDTDSDGLVSFAELQKSTLDALPPETAHRDLVAQLGSRLAIDAVDTDQGDVPISARMLSREEWEEAAAQLHSNRPKS